jgi:hypothetical protein
MKQVQDVLLDCPRLVLDAASGVTYPESVVINYIWLTFWW